MEKYWLFKKTTYNQSVIRKGKERDLRWTVCDASVHIICFWGDVYVQTNAVRMDAHWLRRGYLALKSLFCPAQTAYWFWTRKLLYSALALLSCLDWTIDSRSAFADRVDVCRCWRFQEKGEIILLKKSICMLLLICLASLSASAYAVGVDDYLWLTKTDTWKVASVMVGIRTTVMHGKWFWMASIVQQPEMGKQYQSPAVRNMELKWVEPFLFPIKRWRRRLAFLLLTATNFLYR